MVTNSNKGSCPRQLLSKVVFGLVMACLISVCSAPLLARSEVLVSSLNNTPIIQVICSPGVWLTSPFTTDAQPRLLSSVTLNFQPATNIARVLLFADNAGRPGAILADLGTQTLTGSAVLWTFTPATAVALQPSTTYWVGVGNVSPTNYLGIGTVSNTPPGFTFTGAAGASMTNFAASGFGSGTNPPAPFNSFGNSTTLPFEVDASSIAVLSLVRNSDGTMSILSSGGAGYPHRIQATTNLAPPVVWGTIGTNSFLTNGVWVFRDFGATNFPGRFYRSNVP